MFRTRFAAIRTQFWRSPADQPGWARPALLGIAALAGLGYGWAMARANVETFYGASARSMSESWHDFIFGAFDPAGTVTVDKLPGALWVQALSLRLFGFHIWALVLPQVIEGILTVLVLYRAVRRLAGAPAGLAAAVVLAATPGTVLLNRGNVGDSLLVLLLVLAADAVSAALLTGRPRTLCLAGLWVGLAFQTKMIQAWLVLPGLAAAYLLAAPAQRLRTRIGHVALAGLVTVVVSLSWMTAVSLVPAHDRPYVDGSRNDSVYSQVFYYNGVARLMGAQALRSAAGPAEPFITTLIREPQALNYATIGIAPSWHRLLSGPLGRDGAWLLPAGLAGALAVLLPRRRRTAEGSEDPEDSEATEPGRADPLRAAVVLWGGWWVVLAVFFSAGTYLNSYYIAALAPPVAALCGVGWAALAGAQPRVRATAIAITAAACVGYGLYLLRGAGLVPAWLWVAAIGLLVLAVYLAVFTRTSAVAALALLLIPATASVTVVVRGLGPFDTPFESRQVSNATQANPAAEAAVSATMQRLAQSQPHRRYLLAEDTSLLAASNILFSGDEVLPIGGYLGGVPSPTLATLRSDISNGYVSLFQLPVQPASPDARVQWIQQHCTLAGEGVPRDGVQFGLYSCAGQASATPSSPVPSAGTPPGQ
jgi:4-amino-4-deoxy-L-arabinose transferase-like glycosyltransferase